LFGGTSSNRYFQQVLVPGRVSNSAADCGRVTPAGTLADAGGGSAATLLRWDSENVATPEDGWTEVPFEPLGDRTFPLAPFPWPFPNPFFFSQPFEKRVSGDHLIEAEDIDESKGCNSP
jgi:hypothetical protein